MAVTPPGQPSARAATPAAGDAELRAGLRSLVARYRPSWLAASADDIVQAAWLRVRRHEAEGNGPPGASLLARAAYCAVVDEIRRNRRRKEVPLDDVLVGKAIPGANPEQAVSALDTRRAIVDCLSRTTRERRLAATLYLLGHSVPEAARILDWTTKRAENMVFRGLADLRRCLAAKGLAP